MSARLAAAELFDVPDVRLTSCVIRRCWRHTCDVTALSHYVRLTSSASTIVSCVSLAITVASVQNRTSFFPLFTDFPDFSPGFSVPRVVVVSFSTCRYFVVSCSFNNSVVIVVVVIVFVFNSLVSLPSASWLTWTSPVYTEHKQNTGCNVNKKQSYIKLFCMSTMAWVLK